jgi:hypothetical protein
VWSITIRAFTFLVLFCSAVSVWGQTVASAAMPGCSRASLQGTVDKYLGALKKEDPSLMPLAPQAKCMENRKIAIIKNGLGRDEIASQLRSPQSTSCPNGSRG